jgi:hypothetical protein
MQLDLQKDEQKIRRFIEKRVRDYPAHKNLGPGKDGDPIALMTLGYHLEQAGYFALVFDTRPKADNDGEWTNHIENDVNVLEFPRWQTAFETLCEGGSVDVKLPNGKTRTLDESDDNESVARLFGEMIRETVFSLRDSGAFDSLPLAPKAFFIIEEFDGQWGWPAYESRKTEGALRKGGSPDEPRRGKRRSGR